MSFQERNDKRRVARPERIKPVSQREADSETLPACIWTLRDGRQILVSHRGAPLFERTPGRPAKRSDPNEFVVGIIDRDPIYPPSANPRSDPAIMRRVTKVLSDWQVTL
jgi:hypothetical protein